MTTRYRRKSVCDERSVIQSLLRKSPDFHSHRWPAGPSRLTRKSQAYGARTVIPTPSRLRPLGTPISRSALIVRMSDSSDAHPHARKPAGSCRRSRCEPEGADLEIGVPRGRLARVSSGFHPHRWPAGPSRSLTVAGLPCPSCHCEGAVISKTAASSAAANSAGLLDDK
jgi:hypothetical protein